VALLDDRYVEVVHPTDCRILDRRIVFALVAHAQPLLRVIESVTGAS
jgi:hypothetical protein